MIREGRPADRPRLRAIQTAALTDPWPELLDAALDGPPLVLVADIDRPVGYALAIPDPPLAYLAELAVAPDAQGQGHGGRLLDVLCSRLESRGVETVRLTARADDERARSFYESRGFRQEERITDHYEQADGVLLVLDLDG